MEKFDYINERNVDSRNLERIPDHTMGERRERRSEVEEQNGATLVPNRDIIGRQVDAQDVSSLVPIFHKTFLRIVEAFANRLF